MKRRIWIGLLASLGMAGAAGAQTPHYAQIAPYDGDRAIARTEAEAKAASFVCEKELKAGAKGSAGCERYHAAVIKALGMEIKRQEWCRTEGGASNESSQVRIPDSCLGGGNNSMRIDVLTSLERAKSPATWRKFDQAMGKLY